MQLATYFWALLAWPGQGDWDNYGEYGDWNDWDYKDDWDDLRWLGFMTNINEDDKGDCD